MSSSAALAAAKKRRNVGLGEQKVQQNNRQQQQQQQQQQIREPLSVPQLVTQHDARIFKIERMMNNDRDNNLSQTSLDKIQNEFSQKLEFISKKSEMRIDENIINNKIEKHENDIASLNNNVKTLNKTISDIKTSNTKLHATILEQSKEIEKLKKLFSEQVNDKKS